MQEEIKTLTDLALIQTVAEDEVRVVMTRPYNHENGNTYATDGGILLAVPSSMCKEYEPFKDCRFPNVVPVIESHRNSAIGQSFNLFLKDMKDVASDVRIGDILISKSRYDKVRDITALLGLQGWEVMICKQSVLLVNGLIHLLVMGLMESKTFVPIPLSSEDMTFGMDVNAAKEYVKVFEARKKLEHEEDDVRSCIYTFTIVRYATMYVKADNLKEAEKIAQRHRDDVRSLDFEYPEVDSFEEWSSEPDSSMSTIYTDEGECSYSEVCEQIEEEIEKLHNR